MDHLIIVTGQARAGTSLMMRILSVSGIPVVADETLSFEYARTNSLERNNKWIHDIPSGSAIKVLWPDSGHLPLDRHYKMIWMYRNHKEQARSQRKMAGGNRKWMAKQAKYIRRFNKIVPPLLTRLGAEVLRVSFDELITKPDLGPVEEFLGQPLDGSPVIIREVGGNIHAVGQLEHIGDKNAKIKESKSQIKENIKAEPKEIREEEKARA